MVQYLESVRNYFYKQYKNGKKKRISFESYNRVMKGGNNDTKYNLNILEEFQEFIKFVDNEFKTNKPTNESYTRDYHTTRFKLLTLLPMLKNEIELLPTNNTEKRGFPQIFYIYDSHNKKIILIGLIDGEKEIGGKKYKNISCLLKRPNTKNSGRIAIYNILKKLDEPYNGICLESVPSLVNYYESLGFTRNRGYYIFDRTDLEKLIIRNSPIENTEFVSQFDKIY